LIQFFGRRLTARESFLDLRNGGCFFPLTFNTCLITRTNTKSIQAIPVNSDIRLLNVQLTIDAADLAEIAILKRKKTALTFKFE